MHVLIIPSWYKTPDQPLSGTFFEEQARMLLNKGYKVGILYPVLNSAFNLNTALKQFFKKNQPNDFVDDKIPTMYSFSNAIVRSRFQTINYWFACFVAYKKYKKYVNLYGKPDIIHAHSVFIGGWLARYISKKQKLQYVFTEHTSSIIHSQWITTDEVSKNIVRKTIIDAEAAIFVSDAFKEDLLIKFDIPNNNTLTIPNVVNPIFYNSYVKKEKSLPLILLCIAVFGKNKQHKLLFDALSIILKKGYHVKLNLVGDGAEREELIEYANKLKLQNSINFMGAQTRDIVKREIDKAHIIVSASKFESFGLSIVEAFACGRPVVAIDSGGPRDTVTKENGILVLDNTPEKLADAIILVIDNYENYNQEKIKDDSFEKYSENAVWDMLEPVYNKH